MKVEFHILDQNKNLTQIIRSGEFRKLSYVSTYNETGTWNIILPLKNFECDLLTRKKSYIQIFLDYKGCKREAFSGKYDYNESDFYRNGNSQATYYGWDLKYILDQTEISYPPNTPFTKKSGLSGDVVCQYLSENFGENNNKRIKPSKDYCIECNTVGYGSAWEGEYSETSLSEAIYDLAAFSETEGFPFYVDYNLESNNKNSNNNPSCCLSINPLSPNLNYSLPSASYGKGRFNEYGNIPIVYAFNNNNIVDLKERGQPCYPNCITVVGSKEKRTLDGCGSISYTNRITVVDESSINEWQYEKTIKSNGSCTDEELITKAKEYFLEEFRKSQRITFTPNMNSEPIFGCTDGFNVNSTISVVSPKGTVQNMIVKKENFVADSNGDCNIQLTLDPVYEGTITTI